MSYNITDEGGYSKVLLERGIAQDLLWAYPKTVRIRVSKGVLLIYYNNIIQKIPREYISEPTSTSDEDLLNKLVFMSSGGSGSAVDTNLGITNLTADDNRTFSGGGFNLAFNNLGVSSWSSASAIRSTTGNTTENIGGSYEKNITGTYTRTVEGDSTNIIIEKETPPINTAYLWLNSTSKELYRYDGTHWVSDKKTPIKWTDNNSTTNNTFLQIGTVRSNTSRGHAFNQPVKILALGYRNITGSSQNIRVYLNGVLEQTIAIPFIAGGRGAVNLVTPIVVTANQQIALQYSGTTTNNMIIEMYYKYIGA